MLPFCATQRSDPRWAKPRSETPEPIAHAVAHRPVCPESDTRYASAKIGDEAEMGVRAFVEPVVVGDALLEMPLFLKAGGHVPVALESTYQSAWEAVPRRWRLLIEG